MTYDPMEILISTCTRTFISLYQFVLYKKKRILTFQFVGGGGSPIFKKTYAI